MNIFDQVPLLQDPAQVCLVADSQALIVRPGPESLPDRAFMAAANGYLANAGKERAKRHCSALDGLNFQQEAQAPEAGEVILSALPKLRVEDVIRFVVTHCADERINRETLLSERRQAHLVKTRHLIIWLCYRLTGQSLSQIGHKLGRNHTTILHGFRKIEQLYRHDPRFSRKVDFWLVALVATHVGGQQQQRLVYH